MQSDSQAIERLQQRVADLEMLILHLQRDYQALNEVVLEQARGHEALKVQCEALRQQLNTWSHAAGTESPGEEPPPPHY